MATIKNVRQILPPAVGGQVEVVYDEGDCKYIYPHDTDAYAEVQTWNDAGNTVVTYVEPIFDSDGKLDFRGEDFLILMENWIFGMRIC